MNKPDNFSAAAFRRVHGDEAYDAAERMASFVVGADRFHARNLKDKLSTWIDLLEAIEFRTIFPAPGYEMEDLLGMMRDIHDKIDLTAYAKQAREIALDKELNR
jgi:hypothetical protein